MNNIMNAWSFTYRLGLWSRLQSRLVSFLFFSFFNQSNQTGCDENLG